VVNIQITVCCKLTQGSLVGNISEEMAASIFRAEEKFGACSPNYLTAQKDVVKSSDN